MVIIFHCCYGDACKLQNVAAAAAVAHFCFIEKSEQQSKETNKFVRHKTFLF